MDPSRIDALFVRYERLFRNALAGSADAEQMAAAYAEAFVAASPAGVMTGRNDARLREVIEQGAARYRAIGMKDVRRRGVRISSIDEHHCVAHVAWTAVYARPDAADVTIDFDVHYLVQALDGDPRIFGWISGDEQAVLRAHGIEI